MQNYYLRPLILASLFGLISLVTVVHNKAHAVGCCSEIGQQFMQQKLEYERQQMGLDKDGNVKTDDYYYSTPSTTSKQKENKSNDQGDQAQSDQN